MCFLQPIFKSTKILDKGVDYGLLAPWLGDGLLLTNGIKWKPRRRLLTPAFHFQILNDFVEVFNKQSRICCQLLEEKCQNGPCTIDMYPYTTACTLDIICGKNKQFSLLKNMIPRFYNLIETEAAMNSEVNAQTEKCAYVRAIFKYIHNLSRLQCNLKITIHMSSSSSQT